MATIAQEWIQQGKELGRQEGAEVVRDAILYTLRSRFRLSDSESESVAQRVAKITDLQVLAEVHRHALDAPLLGDFLRRLDTIAP